MNELLWDDYCALTTGGIENAELVGTVYEKLTGKLAAQTPAKQVFKVVIEAVNDVTKSIGADATGK